jgi:magnesium transporter
MNFDRSASPWNMPELGWGFGYLLSLVLMAGIATGLLLFFRLKGWLGERHPRK